MYTEIGETMAFSQNAHGKPSSPIPRRRESGREVDNCLPSSLAHDFSLVGALAKCCLSHSANSSSDCTLKAACFLSSEKELTGKGTRTSSPG